MTKKLVLIVDDDRDFCELVCRVLASAGYECQIANDGVAALQRMTEEYTTSQRDPSKPPRLPDLILLDWLMPSMDGFGFMSALLANPKYREIPVVIISSVELHLEDRALSWVAYLSKHDLSTSVLLDIVATKTR